MSAAMEDFGINATQAGLYMSLFFTGYCITQLPGGVMADKLQPKWILIISTILGGICTWLMSVVSTYELGLVVRLIGGLCAGIIMSSCSKVIIANFEPRQRATAMGILLASPPIGILLANQIAPHLLASVGWRKTFAYMSLFSVLAVVCLILFVKPVQNTNNNGAKKGGLLAGLTSFFTDPQQLLLAMSGFMFMFVNNGFSVWGNKFIQSLGLTGAQGGMIISAFSVSGIIASCMSGSIAQKLNISHKKFIIITLTLMGVFTAIFGMMNSYIALILVGLIYGAFAYLPSTHYTTLASTRAGDQNGATAISAQNLIFQIASMVQPVIIGQFLDKTENNYTIMWFVFAGVCLLGVAICLLFKAEKKKA